MNDLKRSSPPARRASATRWWLVLGVVLTVVVSGAVVGVRTILGAGSTDRPSLPPTPAATGQTVTPSPSPPSRTVTGAPVLIRKGAGPLLPGIRAGQVYAESATGIFRIELATGRITRTAIPSLEEHATFLVGRGWVLVKSRWSPTGVLVRDGRPAAPLPQQFDPEGLLHAGPGSRVWVQPEPTTDPTAATTLRLADLDGRRDPAKTVTAPGSAAPYAIVADGYGGVMLTNRGGIYRLEPGRVGRAGRIRLISRGELIASGGRRLLVWDCDTHAACQMVLVDQRTLHRTSRPKAARPFLVEGGIGIGPNTYGDVQLSPDGTHLAVMASDSSGGFRAHAIDLSSGDDTVIPGTGTDGNANRQLAWSPNSRWLLALTDHHIQAYDTRDHRTRSVPLGEEPLLHLTTANAAGW